jgi:hypothetical protein
MVCIVFVTREVLVKSDNSVQGASVGSVDDCEICRRNVSQRALHCVSREKQFITRNSIYFKVFSSVLFSYFNLERRCLEKIQLS